MTQKKMINLPFFETVSRSFIYMLRNMDLFLKASSIGLAAFVVEILAGFPILCSVSGTDCPENGWTIFSQIVLLIISAGIIVNYCRAVILKAPIDFYSGAFWRRIVQYLLASLLMGLAIVVPFIAAVVVYGALLKLMGIHIAIGNGTLLFSAVALVGWCICLAPVFLILAAVTVDDKSITVKEAYRLAQGNFNKIFWGQSLLMVPGMLLLYILTVGYQFAGSSEAATKMLFTVLFLAVSFFDTCLKASFFAHIYQYFVFYRDKQSKRKTKEY